MPTGYTADLCDHEVSFEQFVLTCARAMGACVSMRDDSWDAPIPERFEPSTYHEQELERLQVELRQLEATTIEDCVALMEAERDEHLKVHQEQIAKCADVRDRLKAMLTRVNQWQPPTSDHEGMKQFMVEQLESTIKFDGWAGTYHLDIVLSMPAQPEQWRRAKIEKILKDIGYHVTEQAKEVERVESRNRWIAALRESLRIEGEVPA